MTRAVRLCLTCLAAAALGPAAEVGRASLYVSDAGVPTVGRYELDGTPINPSLVTVDAPVCLALSDDGASLFVSSFGGTIGHYNAVTGATINASLISGLSNFFDLAVAGQFLFVPNQTTLGKYTTSGDTVNAAFITGLVNPFGVDVSPDGASLYVVSQAAVAKYNAETGAVVNSTFVPLAYSDVAVSSDGSSLFVVQQDGSVGQYNTETGAVINASLITGLLDPLSIAVSGTNLYVTDMTLGTVGHYTTSGATLNPALITIQTQVYGLAAGPEDFVPMLGDFDGDGDLDVADFLILSTNLLTDVTGMTVAQSSLLGDVTADLRIDGRDFAAFRTAYDEANGTGAFAAMAGSIPEPASAWLAATAGAALVGRVGLGRRRRGRM